LLNKFVRPFSGRDHGDSASILVKYVKISLDRAAPRCATWVEHLLMISVVDHATCGRPHQQARSHILEMFMVNRRAFVHRLGIGTVGTLSLLETPATAAATALQNVARRPLSVPRVAAHVKPRKSGWTSMSASAA
jgi:hypothetical protein